MGFTQFTFYSKSGFHLSFPLPSGLCTCSLPTGLLTNPQACQRNSCLQTFAHTTTPIRTASFILFVSLSFSVCPRLLSSLFIFFRAHINALFLCQALLSLAPLNFGPEQGPRSHGIGVLWKLAGIANPLPPPSLYGIRPQFYKIPRWLLRTLTLRGIVLKHVLPSSFGI